MSLKSNIEWQAFSLYNISLCRKKSYQWWWWWCWYDDSGYSEDLEDVSDDRGYKVNIVMMLKMKVMTVVIVMILMMKRWCSETLLASNSCGWRNRLLELTPSRFLTLDMIFRIIESFPFVYFNFFHFSHDHPAAFSSLERFTPWNCTKWQTRLTFCNITFHQSENLRG